MIRRCDGADPNLISEDGTTACMCGLVFDDTQRIVLYPHTPFSPKLTADELDALLRLLPGETA
jgi:hypothetical protein